MDESFIWSQFGGWSFVILAVAAREKQDHRYLRPDCRRVRLTTLGGFDHMKFRPQVVIVEDNSNGVDIEVGDWFSARDYKNGSVASNVFLYAQGCHGKVSLIVFE